jgi:hypothetical protein
MSEEEQIPDPHDIIQMLEYEIADKDHRIEELKAEVKRWQVCFTHAALVVGEQAERYGLMGDEGTDLIEDMMDEYAKQKEKE